VTNARKYAGIPYMERKTKGVEEFTENGKTFRRVYLKRGGPIVTTKSYLVAVRESARHGKANVRWTGQPTEDGRWYGVYVRSHQRHKPRNDDDKPFERVRRKRGDRY
jgi:hypothetical protein